MTSPATEKRARALELHLAGATYDAIANAVGYASRSGAHKAVQAALEGLGTRTPTEAVTTELARLDAMLVGLWPKARRGEVAAIDRVLKIGERRTSLLTMTSGAAEPDGVKETALSEFEKRLRDRESAPKAPRRAKSS